MTSNPTATPGASTILGAIPGLGPAMQALQVIQGVNSLAGPKGALTTGDPSAIASSAQSIYGGINGAMGATGGSQPTLQNTLGMTPDQFSAYPPDVRQELLRKKLGR